MVAVLYGALSVVLGGLMGVAGLASTDPGGSLVGMGLLFAPLQVASGAAYLVPLVAAFFVHGRLAEELDGTALADDLDALSVGFDAPRPAAPRSTPPAPTPPETPPPAPPPAPPTTPASGPDGDAPDAPDGRPGGFRGGGFG